MNHHLFRILQAAVAVAVIYCCCCCVALASVELACTGPKLNDIVYQISKTRFDTRDTKPKLARCQSFVKLIGGQQELAESLPDLAVGEPRRLLDVIAQVLERRASCPGQPMGLLNSLQEFIGDCQELVELASGGHKIQRSPRPRDELREKQAPGSYLEVELERDASGQLGLYWVSSIYGSVFVSKVMAGSPAARAGIKFGDQLVQVDGQPTANLESVSPLTLGNRRVKLLVRKSPMEQTFLIKKLPGEKKPGFFCNRGGLEISGISFNMAAARAGLLKGFNWVAVNGESVVGLDPASMTPGTWLPEGDYTVTIMPKDFFSELTRTLTPSDLNTIRIEHNKILADEKAKGSALE